VDPVPDPLLLRKSGSAGNRTRDLWVCSQEVWPLDHRGGHIIANNSVNSDDILFYQKAIGSHQTANTILPEDPSLLSMWLEHSLTKQACLGLQTALSCATKLLNAFGAPMTCKIWGFNGCDYDECLLLGNKIPVPTSLKTIHLRYRAQPVNAIWDLTISRRWLWRMPSSGMWWCVVLVWTDASEKHIVSIRVKIHYS
jgi:hypothetical protein